MAVSAAKACLFDDGGAALFFVVGVFAVNTQTVGFISRTTIPKTQAGTERLGNEIEK